MSCLAARFRAVLVVVSPLAIVVALDAGASRASGRQQTNAYSGADIFKSYCAVCHGTSAKGDGPLAASMKKRPPDLTQFAKQNDGKYPADLVFKIIDGRQPVAGHGGPDMPVWGDAFKASAVGGSEEAVKGRIQGLVDYLETLQEKRPQ
jgi:mono/diheme cytochrome c family protein